MSNQTQADNIQSEGAKEVYVLEVILIENRIYVSENNICFK